MAEDKQDNLPKIKVPYLCQKDLLAVMGTADPSRKMAPYDDENYEIWSLAVLTTYPDWKRSDLLFEMHTEGYWGREEIKKRLKKEKVPIYMQEKYKEIPQSIPFPMEIMKRYRKYHTSSISYMLALAYHSFLTTGKPKHVALFGIVMSAGEEYGEQRPCCEYWLGRMEGVGMEIEIAATSAVLASPGLYGYETYNPVCYELRQRIQGLDIGLKHSREKEQDWAIQKSRQEGAISESQYWLRRFQKGAFN